MDLFTWIELFVLCLALVIISLKTGKWGIGSTLAGCFVLGCIGMAAWKFGLFSDPEPVQAPAHARQVSGQGTSPASGQPQQSTVQPVKIPAYSRQVTDLTATLSSAQQQQLTARLQALQQATGAELAVLIVPGTGAQGIEQFSMQVVENWKLGRKGVDDGVLLLLAKDDRQLRIEVGYGLEGRLTDALSSRIINDSMLPLLKQGDFAGAILAGVGGIGAAIGGQPAVGDVPSADSTAPASTAQSGSKSHAPAGTSSPRTLTAQERNLGMIGIIALALSFVCGPLLGSVLPSTGQRCLIAGVIGTAIAGYVLQDLLLALGCGGLALSLCIIASNTGKDDGSGRRSGSSSSSSSSSRGGGGRFGGGGSSGRW